MLEMVEDSPDKKLTFLFVGSEHSYHFINQDGKRGRQRVGHLASSEANKIQYLLWLNKFGREKFRDGNAGVKTLVGLLGDVVSHSFPEVLTEVNRCCYEWECTHMKTSLLYDLLKESPHLLCSLSGYKVASPRKRKHAEIQP